MVEILPVIDKKATGDNIKRLMKINKITILDLQMAFRFQSPTNIYGWCAGKSMPSADHLLQLSILLNCKIDDILIPEEIK